MVVYPKEEQEFVDSILKEFPYSRLTVHPVRYQGHTYMAINSTDLNLVKVIHDKFYSINEDPVIRSM